MGCIPCSPPPGPPPQSGERWQRLGQEGWGRDSEGGRDWDWWAETRAEWAEPGAGRGAGEGVEETGMGGGDSGWEVVFKADKEKERKNLEDKNQRKTEE